MATKSFVGGAAARAQVETITLGGTWAAGETATIAIGAAAVTYTVQSGDDANAVATALGALAAAATEGQFSELTWATTAPTITATGAAGVPFTVSVSETSVSGTISTSTTTAATGPYHWDEPRNWSDGAVPGAGDTVFVDRDGTAIRYGLNAGTSLTALIQTAGEIGLPARNSAGYPEYRTQRLVVSCTDVQVRGTVTRSRIDPGAVACVAVVDASSGNAVDIKLNHASAQLQVVRGSAVLGADPSEVAQAGTVYCGAGAQLEIGYSATVANATTAGTLTLAGAVTSTLTVEDGETTNRSTAGIGTVTINGGTVYHQSAATLTTCTVKGGVLDCSNDVRPKTLTNCTIGLNGQIVDPFNTLTISNGLTIDSSVDRLFAQ